MEAMAMGLRWTMASVFATLVFATTATTAARKVRPELNLSEVSTRIRSWWVMAVVFSIAVVAHPRAGLVFLGVVGLGAMYEYARMARIPWYPLAVVSTAAFVSLAVAGPGAMAVTAAIGVLGCAAVATMVGDAADLVEQFATTAFGVVVALGFFHAPALLTRPTLQPGGAAGLLVMLVIITQASDVAQFITGRLAGRTPISPRISPNKTVAGFIGGLGAAATLGTGLALLLTDFAWWHGTLLGLTLATTGFLGDLLVSAIKREYRCKDAGTLIPGHGGILDRIDSLVLSAPVFYYLAEVLG